MRGLREGIGIRLVTTVDSLVDFAVKLFPEFSRDVVSFSFSAFDFGFPDLRAQPFVSLLIILQHAKPGANDIACGAIAPGFDLFVDE